MPECSLNDLDVTVRGVEHDGREEVAKHVRGDRHPLMVAPVADVLTDPLCGVPAKVCRVDHVAVAVVDRRQRLDDTMRQPHEALTVALASNERCSFDQVNIGPPQP